MCGDPGRQECMRQHFATRSLLEWKGFVRVFLYRHIKAFMTHNVDMGPKRIAFCLLPRGFLDAPVEGGGSGSWPFFQQAAHREKGELVQARLGTA